MDSGTELEGAHTLDIWGAVSGCSYDLVSSRCRSGRAGCLVEEGYQSKGCLLYQFPIP